MEYRWFAALVLLLCPALSAAADDRAWLTPAPKRAMSQPAMTCAAAEAKGKESRRGARRCRLAPESAIVSQVAGRHASRAPWTPGSSANGVTSVPQLLGRAVRSPKRRRDGDAVAITAAGGCPRRLPAGYACVEDSANQDLFVRALVERPSPTTAETLDKLLIPAIRDVPPIVIIAPDRAPGVVTTFDPTDVAPGLFFDFGAALP